MISNCRIVILSFLFVFVELKSVSISVEGGAGSLLDFTVYGRDKAIYDRKQVYIKNKSYFNEFIRGQINIDLFESISKRFIFKLYIGLASTIRQVHLSAKSIENDPEGNYTESDSEDLMLSDIKPIRYIAPFFGYSIGTELSNKICVGLLAKMGFVDFKNMKWKSGAPIKRKTLDLSEVVTVYMFAGAFLSTKLTKRINVLASFEVANNKNKQITLSTEVKII
ncbi:hypothetical protein [Candidatus Nesciobacter abundans]|uniref:Uncharacterized protein n=1 Tax=Candidatus Nesciobacter abundans TaxID=2601668 RepID=A0A5C0UJZ5_9PROT|nr:hypothetical protein [Candidatus Nesciobacter abundans]QEK39164.1 hypothetical protein FZC36_01815 [Candidatus Nesciobacter abundans]